MPKVVDIEVRRRELAEALWRVIRREGLERASVRNVAREAGLSMGALRHYFGTQDELLAFAMRLVIEGARGRIEILDLSSRNPREAVERVLRETLPLDEERVAEAEVWLALTGRALVDPALHALRAESYELLEGLCRRMIGVLVESGGSRIRIKHRPGGGVALCVGRWAGDARRGAAGAGDTRSGNVGSQTAPRWPVSRHLSLYSRNRRTSRGHANLSFFLRTAGYGRRLQRGGLRCPPSTSAPEEDFSPHGSSIV